jgi:ATP-dependent DNA ligase
MIVSLRISPGRLIYAGRVGTGMSVKTLAALHERLKPLAIPTMPLSAPHLAGAVSAARWR